MLTMIVQEDFLGILVPQPMCLNTTRERDALGSEAAVFGKLEVDVGSATAKVTILSEGAAPQLRPCHGEDDIFEVGVSAPRALERGGPESDRGGGHCMLMLALIVLGLQWREMEAE